MPIEWNYPQPRSGIAGALDRFLGPGMERTEILLNFVGMGILTLLIIIPLWLSGISWSPLQWVIAILIAVDICGGALTLAMGTGKRWVFRRDQGFLQHIGFVALHIHPFIIAFFFSGTLIWAATAYLLVLFSAYAVLQAPLYLQRPVSVFCIALAVLSGGILAAPEGFFWFAPLFFIKLIGGHCTREEPYRPDTP